MNFDKWIYMIRNLPAELRGRLYPKRIASGRYTLSHLKFLPELSIRHFRAGLLLRDYGVVSRRVVTDDGVAALVDNWDGNTSFDIATFNFHGAGTGTTAEAQTDSALQAEITTGLDPDSTRATGVQTQPSANVMRSVGTLTFDADAAVTEHGLLDQASTAGGTLWDRSVFAAINVVGANPDSIEFTYDLTVNAGG